MTETHMRETHTIREVVGNEKLRRLLAYEVLSLPFGWERRPSDADIAEALAAKVDFFELRRVCLKYKLRFQRVMFDAYALTAMECFAMATAEERIACLLAALLPDKVTK